MYAFTRNAVAAFDWGGVIMNHWMSKDNKSRHQRFTSDIFEIATGITNQCSVNCMAMQPNNLSELPQYELDFLKTIPTAWDETRFIDGYPGKYVVIARRCGEKWYVGGINGGSEALALTLQLPMLTGQTVNLMTDEPSKANQRSQANGKGKNEGPKAVKVNKKGEVKVTLQPMGGIVIYQ